MKYELCRDSISSVVARKYRGVELHVMFVYGKPLEFIFVIESIEDPTHEFITQLKNVCSQYLLTILVNNQHILGTCMTLVVIFCSHLNNSKLMVQTLNEGFTNVYYMHLSLHNSLIIPNGCYLHSKTWLLCLFLLFFLLYFLSIFSSQWGMCVIKL